MLTEASSSEHDPKAKWNLVWMKKFSSNFTSFCRGQKGDVYTKNCIRKRKYYKQKVILRLKKCPIGRGITDSVWVSATIIFCLIRVAFTFSLQLKLQLFKILTLNGNVRWIFLLSRALLVQLSAVCADMTIMTASWSVLRRISMIRRVYPFWSSNAHPALIITLSWSKRYALFLLIRIPSSWRPYMLFIMESTGITRLPPQMIWGSPDHAFLHG